MASDDFYFSRNAGGVRWGRRRRQRTEVCRPCLVWRRSEPGFAFQGVVLTISPYGLGVRMLDLLQIGEEVMVQMMRDEEFRVPLSQPHPAKVIWREEDDEGFFDHGIALDHPETRKRLQPNIIRRKQAKVPKIHKGPQRRMHTHDLERRGLGTRRKAEEED